MVLVHGKRRQRVSASIRVLLVIGVSLLCFLFGSHEENNDDTRTAGRNGWVFSSVLVAAAAAEDLYQILGVPRSASVREIKKAYRKKALDTHPDKNKGVPAEEAAAAFHRVVHAFEVLSDATSRKRYDRTGRTDGNEGGNSGGRQRSQQGGFQWTFRWNTGGGRQRVQPLKDRFDVKQAQSRILHIVSLAQLETIMTSIIDDDDDDDDGTATSDAVLERNLLICFYTPPLEKKLMEEMVYPWPFAAMSSQGIWWEDLLQTTVVRYHNSNDLTEFFGIPKGADLRQPIFLFGKKGQSLGDKEAWNHRRLSTNDRKVFDKWVWQQLEVEVTFINEHDHPVELYWIHDRRAQMKGTIPPNGGRHSLTTMLAHEWWVRDVRTDTTYQNSPGRYKLTDETCLLNVKILTDSKREYVIPKGTCYDLSGHCSFWNRRGTECDKNPGFMHDVCRKTCKRCQETAEEPGQEAGGSDEL